MEKEDLKLIQEYRETDLALNSLYEEHLSLENELKKINRKHVLSPHEDLRKKELQKKKLKGRDELEQLLNSYRKKQETHDTN
ncbi:MAG: DUF465 domain-containing protein [Deltaproteobacteria bacterium CG_4_10_14_0_2_um_filter_43_8]|nr:MAG: DUF465 domain-containing protein [Deltaproteobacteria bacterium CG11_big_fil_rev_8_21_14_0_20_42_23]PJA18729.1 MAG: DUF465 domain-containing protein [Deltaproteobacteria bacterium CG_4_10_14_0_2_um_filter_43_8]PJC64395.1 MAG: DUF465 domain-containing protein [Deltaproteobacteria bacterium CG_4_9_14_0_2_um_filter_42_21]